MHPLPVKQPSGKIVLEFSRVSFSYPSSKVLSDTSFHIHEGEFVSLLGPNGAGKSTILKLLLGLEIPERGEIRLFGTSATEGKKYLGYVPQYANFDSAFPISVYEVVRMGCVTPWKFHYSKEDRERIDEALSLMDVHNLSSRPYYALSGGQRRRVLVARALASRPKMLILDEPTANMDALSERNFYEALSKIKGDTTIFIVTHDTTYVSALTDRVLCVGEHPENGMISNVVQHPLAAAEEESESSILKVLHSSKISHSCECITGAHHE
ncbi:MAG: ABC transporter ATP-binding protein [Sphaerochaetaceae bacterium]|nr:ABC transporter ATP-binding protein [Sphaerochaetaceae bacterium]